MKTDSSNKVSSVKKIYLTFGFYAGFVAIFLTLSGLYFDNTFTSLWSLLPLVSVFIFGVLGALRRKRFQNGYLAFGQSVVTMSFIYGIGMAISILFDQILIYYRIIPSEKTVDISILKLIQTFTAQILVLLVIGIFINMLLSIFLRKETTSK